MANRRSSIVRARSLSEPEKASYIASLEAKHRILREDAWKHAAYLRVTALIIIILLFERAFLAPSGYLAPNYHHESRVDAKALAKQFKAFSNPYINSMGLPKPFENFTLAHFGWILQDEYLVLNLVEDYIPGAGAADHSIRAGNHSEALKHYIEELEKPWQDKSTCGTNLKENVCQMAVDAFGRARNCLLHDNPSCRIDLRNIRYGITTPQRVKELNRRSLKYPWD